MKKLLFAAPIVGAFLLSSAPAAWGALSIPDDLATPRGAFSVIALFTALALAPAALVMLTSFTRIIVVLSFLRNAVASPQIPPNAVLVGLALFLTAFTMTPTWKEVNANAVKPYIEGKIDETAALKAAEVPLRKFMLAHTRKDTLTVFLDYLDKRPETPEDTPLEALVPAFVVSELRTAFEMGFMIYVPFVLIDLAVGTALMSFGMIMLPPVMVSLPLKLMVFVLADGWDAVVGTLLASYR